MSYKTYEKYKNSYIDWIDEIPKHWHPYKLKHIINEFIAGGTPKSSNEAFWSENNDGIPWVAIGDMSDNEYVTSTNKSITREGLADKNLRILKKGTLIYSIFASLGKTAILNIDATTNQAILGLITSNKIDNHYLKYYLNALQTTISSFSNENTQENLNTNIVKNMEIAIPIDLNEQQQIANYLDKKTAKIDATIAKNEELIELLEEKRVALINQVVTKGLDSDVPMKDSGVEWIGEIPENWDVVLFKRLFNLIKDGTHGSFERVDDGEPLLSAKNIFNDKINISKTESCISKDDFLSIVSNGFPKKDDLLMTIVGTIGRSCVYDKEFPLAFQRSVSFIRLTYDNPYYYNYFIKSQIFQSQLLVKAKQSAQKGIYLNDIKECLVIRPPYEIQIEIAKYLQNRITKINETTSKIQDNINLLEEYKTSLIHHVVTGKIDVRGEEI